MSVCICRFRDVGWKRGERRLWEGVVVLVRGSGWVEVKEDVIVGIVIVEESR